jgi:hypothetical protein
MSVPDNKNTVAERPEVGVLDKRKPLKRPEDRAYIVLMKIEM